MEKFTAELLPAFLAIAMLRRLLLLSRSAFRLLLRTAEGLLLLMLLNRAAGLTGLLLPINPITVLTAGFLGFPGICCIAFLELCR